MNHLGMTHAASAVAADAMEPMCAMSMLFTWDPTNLCIIFKSWHVYTTSGLIWTLLAIVALTASYEGLREACRRYEARAARLDFGGELPTDAPRSKLKGADEIVPRRSRSGEKMVRAAFYAAQVSMSFFIM